MTDLIPAVRSMPAATPARWTALASVDAAPLGRAPAQDEWFAVQGLRHLVDTEAAVFRARVFAIREERDFPAVDPDEGGGPATDRSARDLAAELGRMRAESLAALDTVSDGDLECRARHAELGLVSLRELLNEWAAHDTMHLVQAERALMQAFIPGSGPWRSFVADHDVETAGG